ncbi:hypothetical protein ACJMK2_043424 [Sinanodonta woodiana]|uniref:Heme-binding protein 2 n=1 Tax=Sinanodonta woodiana TaxID=1069815 RepID=A0ABD3VXC8_SINWO
MVPVLFLLGIVLGSQARELRPILESFPPLTAVDDYQHAEKLIRLYRWHKPEFCHEYNCPEYEVLEEHEVSHARIPMTLPVLTRMEHTPVLGKSCQCNWTMLFMLPNDYQFHPPKPLDPDVRISTLPAINVYVRSFSGLATSKDYKKQLGELSRAIGNYRKYSQKEYFTAEYDAPFVRCNRHNEVWFLASEQFYPKL